MFISTVLFGFLIQSFLFGDCASNHSIGGLKPVDNLHCEAVQKVLKNTIYSTDYCIFMLMEHIDCPFRYDGTTVVTLSLDKMFSGFVAEAQKKFYCDKTFTMFDSWRVFKHFMVGRNLTKKFEPYTRLGFYARFNSSDHGQIFDEAHLRQIYLGALHVYYGRVLSEDVFELEDVLTGELVQYTNISHLEKTYKSIRNYMMHPLFDTSLQRNEVTVSLYHCDPFVIRLEEMGSLLSYDGVEYRFLMESTKNWKVHLVDRSNLLETGDPWGQIENDVAEGTSNFALCSAWLTDHLINRFDVTGYSSHHCGTFLVPKPAPIAQASYIYYPLEDTVWVLIFSFLVITAILYHCFSRILTSSSVGHWITQYKDNIPEELDTLSRSFMDIINIITSHGLPKILQRSPIQILIISWTLLSFLLGTAYSTKLMSVLTRPLFTKAVDTVHEFIEEGTEDFFYLVGQTYVGCKRVDVNSPIGLFWGEFGERASMKEDLIVTGNPDYIELASRMRVEKDLQERTRNIETGNYAKFVKTLSNKYVMDTETIANYSHEFRLMKSCVREYFTVFPFDKKSPYTRYFNMKLGRFTQGGIIKYWLSLMNTKYGKSFMRSFVEKNYVSTTNEPKPLKIGNFVGAFYVLAIGSSIAGITLLIEIYVQRKQWKKPSRIGQELR